VFVRSFVRSLRTVVSSVGETWRSEFFNQYFFQAAAKRGFQLVFSKTASRIRNYEKTVFFALHLSFG
jgi:hypothetical protein